MKIIIFGASGTVGRHLVEQSLAAGHYVRAFARRPEALAMDHQHLELWRGDVYDADAVGAAIMGQDAVLCVLGSKSLRGDLRSVGTENIVRAMRAQGLERLIVQSTLGAGLSWSNLNFFWKWIMFRGLLNLVFKDHLKQEQIVVESGLDWTIVRPSAFTDEPLSSEYRHGFSTQEQALKLTIPRASVAEFMLRSLHDALYIHRSPGVSF